MINSDNSTKSKNDPSRVSEVLCFADVSGPAVIGGGGGKEQVFTVLGALGGDGKPQVRFYVRYRE